MSASGCLKSESLFVARRSKATSGIGFKFTAGVCGTAVRAVIYVIYAESVIYACGHPSRRLGLQAKARQDEV